MIIKRREFLQAGSLATASMFVPGFLKSFGRQPVPPGNKVVVIIQLSGGNDGLNTVIPVENDIYYRERPRLAIAKNKSLLLNDTTGLNPALPLFKDLYANGNLGILNGVGYPNPDRSHFRSMDIWQSASHSNEYIHTGWLGRYLDAQCTGCDRPTQALEIDDVLSLAMKGEYQKGLAFKEPRRLYQSSKNNFLRELNASHKKENEVIDFLYKTMADTQSSADYIYDQSKLRSSGQSYPNTELGKNLKTISSLVLSDINTRVYYVSLGSFDTHINQEALQTRLFTQLNDAVAAFTNEMKVHGRFDDVLMMAFSEFGRRVSQNASNGTDHGAANNMFFISGGLSEKGLLNDSPDLSDLQNGDLKYQVDFKSVYATVLNKWLGADDKKILGANYPGLNFLG